VDFIDIDQIAQPPPGLWAARRDLARAWLDLPAEQVAIHFSADLGAAHRAMLQCPLRHFPPSDADGSIRDAILDRLRQEAPSPGVLLAGMLFFFPHEWPQFWELDQTPGWLIDHYLAYMLETPSVLHGPGQAEKLVRFMEDWFGYLRRQVQCHPGSKLWQNVAQCALRTQFLNSYFTTGNLRELMTSRARILEHAVAAAGTALDFQFSAARRPGRIRVGVLAPDFSPSPETAAALPLYRYLDRTQFETTLLAIAASGHPMERFCAAAADHFVALPPEPPRKLDAIRALDLDILLIADNITAVANFAAQLAVHRLAPVQIATISSCVTTGMRNIDARLSGTLAEPASGAQDHYTEKLLLIDGSGHCYDYGIESPGLASPPLPRQEAGVRPDDIVFVSGANGHKIIPELEETWTKILARIPGSRLMLHPVNPNWTSKFPVEAFLSRMKKTLEKQGVSPARLLIFRPCPTRGEYLRRIAMADIYLDSFPFSGATTILDALLVGLPTVVWDGCHFRSLLGAAMMREIDIPELIGANPDQYIELAVRLAGDARYRDQIKGKIATALQSSPAFLDAPAYGRKVGEALKRIWEARGTASM